MKMLKFSTRVLLLVATLVSMVAYWMSPSTAVVKLNAKQIVIFVVAFEQNQKFSLYDNDIKIANCRLVELDARERSATICLPRWKKWQLQKGTYYSLGWQSQEGDKWKIDNFDALDEAIRSSRHQELGLRHR